MELIALTLSKTVGSSGVLSRPLGLRGRPSSAEREGVRYNYAMTCRAWGLRRQEPCSAGA